MSETLKGMTSIPKDAKKAATAGEVERAAVRELVKAARARGEDLTGPDGLLKAITATVVRRCRYRRDLAGGSCGQARDRAEQRR